LRGSFTVGTAPTPGPAPKPPAGVVTPASKLVLTSGPGFTITLKTSAGATVKKLKTGTYTTIVRDRARVHDAHLLAPGFDKRTTVRFIGTQTWKVKLAKPGMLRFMCDPHASQGMRGSARIVR
jgi:Copper binding proteins, plastocyanin/azurin family